MTCRLLKNAQMQGPRYAFHLPLRQAILRNEAYLDVRRNKPAPWLTRGRMRETQQMGFFQQSVREGDRVDESATFRK